MENSQEKARHKPWQEISALLHAGSTAEQVEAALEGLDSAELLHTVFSLNPADQRALLSILPASRTTSLVEELPDTHVADLIEVMPASAAASIVDGL
jgi:Mg/Co/Ni transporter MgtE